MCEITGFGTRDAGHAEQAHHGLVNHAIGELVIGHSQGHADNGMGGPLPGQRRALNMKPPRRRGLIQVTDRKGAHLGEHRIGHDFGAIEQLPSAQIARHRVDHSANIDLGNVVEGVGYLFHL